MLSLYYAMFSKDIKIVAVIERVLFGSHVIG
jgi:hypothetical protein